MRTVRPVIIRCRWDAIPADYAGPPEIPESALRETFSPNQAPLWGVTRLWQDAGMGALAFDAPQIVDVGVLAGWAHGSGERVAVIAAAIAAAKGQITIADEDPVAVVIHPAPSNSGGDGGRGCLLDAAATHAHWAHEFGHALGFDHGYGPAFGNPQAEYCHPYCVMSERIYGYRSPWSATWPPNTTRSAGVPQPWEQMIAPLPSAATVWKFLPDFAQTAAVQRTVVLGFSPEFTTMLTSYGAAKPTDKVLLVADAGDEHTLIEMRGAHGWDRELGIGPKPVFGLSGPGNDPIEPAVVISTVRANGPVTFAAHLPLAGGTGQRWDSPSVNLTVELGAIDANHCADVKVYPTTFEPIVAPNYLPDWWNLIHDLPDPPPRELLLESITAAARALSPDAVERVDTFVRVQGQEPVG